MNAAMVIALARRLFKAPPTMNVGIRLYDRTIPKSTAAQQLASWREVEELPLDERPAAHRARSEMLYREGEPWTDEEGKRELILEVFTSWNVSGSPPESDKQDRRHVSARYDARATRLVMSGNDKEYCTRDLLALRLSNALAALLTEEINAPEKARAERELIEAERFDAWAKEESLRLAAHALEHAKELRDLEKGRHE